MSIDLNHGATKGATIGVAVNELINRALLTRQNEQAKRDYLGASLIGETCLRRVQYEATAVPRDGGRHFNARTLRIFEAGHMHENMVAGWLRAASLDLRTHGPDGQQFGFSAVQGRIRGHADGIIHGGGPTGMTYPALWENKALGAETWAEVRAQGVQAARPVYAAQIALYQAYLSLHEAPAVFTAINRDNLDLHVELVPFDGALAQSASDRAVRVLQALDAGETLPRHATDADHFVCLWCSWQDRCWERGT